MKPLCKKIYLEKVIEIVVLLFCIFIDIVFIVTKGDDFSWLILIVPFTTLLAWMLISSIYWIFQPKILIYQYETGIVINRKVKIEYKSIERIYHKNYIRKDGKWGKYYKDTCSGIIYIKLKSGRTHKIRNALDPFDTVNTISRIINKKG